VGTHTNDLSANNIKTILFTLNNVGLTNKYVQKDDFSFESDTALSSGGGRIDTKIKTIIEASEFFFVYEV
jgi:hypothetical protein